MKKYDNKTFLYLSLICPVLYPVDKDPQKVSKYETHISYFDEVFKSLKIKFPVKLNNIPTF